MTRARRRVLLAEAHRLLTRDPHLCGLDYAGKQAALEILERVAKAATKGRK